MIRVSHAPKILNALMAPLMLATTCVVGLSTTAPAQAQAPAAKPEAPKLSAADTAALQMLKDSAAAYSALNSFSGKVSWQRGKAAPTSGSLTWQKPGTLMSEVKAGATTNQSYLSEGKLISLRTDAKGATRYTSIDAPTNGQSLADAMSSIGRNPVELAKFLNADPLQMYGSFIKSASMRAVGAEEIVGLDVAADALQAVEVKLELPGPAGPVPVTMTYLLSKADKLPRRYNMSYTLGGREISNTEMYTEVKGNATLDAVKVGFKAPEGAKLVEDLDPTYDERLKVGAVPIALKATDTTGKPISFDDYKGKVVLVDFWASWCGPCVQEMPNVIAAYNKFNPKGFDIVGVSLDQTKEAMEKYVAANKMPWRQICDGKFWDAEVGKQFGVRAIPFTMLLGRDGKIAALNLRGEALDKAIEAALAKGA